MGTIWPPEMTGNAGPKYIVLIQSLRAAIRSGELVRGERLPPVRELAWQLEMTPGTVARAYKMAIDEGLLAAAVGRGTFVAGNEMAPPPIEEPLINTTLPDFVDFRGAHVPDLGQGAAIRAGLARISSDNHRNYQGYPTEDTDLAARQALVGYLDSERVGRVSAADIVLGLGAQNSVILTLQTCLSGASPVILTENLAYPGIRHASRLLRSQLVGIEMDNEGVRPDRMEEALRKNGGQVFVTSAEIHSPTTNRTSYARKQELTNLARAYNLQIIEDDCHCVTRPDIPSYRSLAPERSWFVSSLTKVYSASLRFGYILCPEHMSRAARQVAQSSFYGLPQPMLDLCTDLLNSGAVESGRAQIEADMKARVKTAVNILGKWDISWRPDAPFLWLRLPTGWRGSSFAVACEAKGIRIKPADEFALADGVAPNAVRVALNRMPNEAQCEAALRAINHLLENPPQNVDV